jgi:hypothetical protein
MKLASNLGMYEDEWNDDDWLLMYGEVPVIIMLWHDPLVPGPGRTEVGNSVATAGRRGNRKRQHCQPRHQGVAARVRLRQSRAGCLKGDVEAKTRDGLTLRE